MAPAARRLPYQPARSLVKKRTAENAKDDPQCSAFRHVRAPYSLPHLLRQTPGLLV